MRKTEGSLEECNMPVSQEVSQDAQSTFVKDGEICVSIGHGENIPPFKISGKSI